MLLPTTKKHQFAVLDGLRGFGALSVLGFHLVQQHVLGKFPFAGLAVDFFYMLSGFVIAFAYEPKLRAGTMTLKAFAWIRFVRLYPLLFVGTSMGILLGFLAAHIKHDVTYQQIALSGFLGLLLLPSYVFSQWGTAFPFNMAQWSLTFEIFANAVFAVLAPKLTTRVLIGVVGFTALLLIAMALAHGDIYGGYDKDNFVYGFGRVLFPFFAGVLIFRFRRRPRHAPLLATSLIVVLIAFIMLPPWHAGLFTLPYVILLFPAIIVLGAASEVGAKASSFFRLLGTLSYPLYILQSPILRIGEEVLKRKHFGLGGSIAFALVEAVIVLAVSYGALTLYDLPLRRFMRRRMARPRQAIAGNA
ncbi:acyltransferase [Acidisoma cellulosilytica]|uniref:Acyltransferase n=1 Tax=Acidisoma cellulosilyticum TaxID=2802395 RepID=A0A964E4K4_9PROT|nr:acyltransferase [Acidisoma cellulosilyticum]MCB8881566.1 acyltransferase [Acidisoma cellulosilyticum]